MTSDISLPDYLAIVEDVSGTVSFSHRVLSDLNWVIALASAMESGQSQDEGIEYARKKLMGSGIRLSQDLCELARDCPTALAGIVKRTGPQFPIDSHQRFNEVTTILRDFRSKRGIVWMDFNLTLTMRETDRNQTLAVCGQKLNEGLPNDILQGLDGQTSYGGMMLTLEYGPSLEDGRLIVFTSANVSQPFVEYIDKAFGGRAEGCCTLRGTVNHLGMFYVAAVRGLNLWFESNDWFAPLRRVTQEKWFKSDAEHVTCGTYRRLPHTFPGAEEGAKSAYMEMARQVLPWLSDDWYCSELHDAMKGLFGARSLLGEGKSPSPVRVGSVLLAATHACWIEPKDTKSLSLFAEVYPAFLNSNAATAVWLQPVADSQTGSALVQAMVRFFAASMKPDRKHGGKPQVQRVEISEEGFLVRIRWLDDANAKTLRSGLAHQSGGEVARRLFSFMHATSTCRDKLGLSTGFELCPMANREGYIRIRATT